MGEWVVSAAVIVVCCGRYEARWDEWNGSRACVVRMCTCESACGCVPVRARRMQYSTRGSTVDLFVAWLTRYVHVCERVWQDVGWKKHGCSLGKSLTLRRVQRTTPRTSCSIWFYNADGVARETINILPRRKTRPTPRWMGAPRRGVSQDRLARVHIRRDRSCALRPRS